MIQETVGILGAIDKGEFYSEGLKDFLTLELGGKLESPHPSATMLRNAGATIGEVAAIVSDKSVRSQDDVGPHHITAALASSDFKWAMSNAVQQRLTTSTNELMADVLRCTRPVPVEDYKPVGVPQIDVDEFEDSPEGGAVKTFSAGSTGEEIQLKRQPKNLVFSRELLMNSNSTEMLSGLFDAIVQSSSRAVARDLVELLNTNPFLSDAQPWIDPINNNVAVGTGLSVSTISEAMQLLSDMPTAEGSEDGGIRGRTLICPVSLYAEANTLLAAMALSADNGMNVAFLPKLTHWYLVGSPENSPIGYATFGGGDALSVTQIPPGPAFDNDSLGYRCRNEFAFAPINRNIVKVALA